MTNGDGINWLLPGGADCIVVDALDAAINQTDFYFGRFNTLCTFDWFCGLTVIQPTGGQETASNCFFYFSFFRTNRS